MEVLYKLAVDTEAPFYLRNPGPEALFNFTKNKCVNEMARGLSDPNRRNCYWWDGSYLIHMDMSRILGIEYDEVRGWGEGYANYYSDGTFGVEGNAKVFAPYVAWADQHNEEVLRGKPKPRRVAVAGDLSFAWVTPEGEVIPVDSSHWQVLVERGIVQPKYNEDGTEDTDGDYFEEMDLAGSYRKAFDQGWARLSGDSVQYRGKMTRPQAEAVEDFMAQSGQDAVFVNDLSGNSGLGTTNYVETDGLAKVLQGLARGRRPLLASWYMRLKQAMPLMSVDERQDRGLHYMDIGHQQFDGLVGPEQAEEEGIVEEMYVIFDRGNGQWEMENIPADDGNSHYRKWRLKNDADNLIAKGRYSRSNQDPDGEASVVWGQQIAQLELKNPRRMDFLKRRVEQMLEQKYGPKVVIWPF